MRTRWFAAAVAVALFIVDRVTRILAFRSDARDLVPGLLRSEPTYNDGIAFGISVPGGWLVPLLGVLVVLVCVLAYTAYRQQRLTTWWAALLVLAGATSNLLDRLTFGTVRDFLHVTFWPTTGNLGDYMITVGAILLLATSLRRSHPAGG